MHEIVVYGGGAIYRDVLQGVALMSGANGLSTLLRIAMLLGLIITIFKMAFDLDVKSAFKWFLTSMVIFNLMWVPKAQVHITDRFDPSLTGADVANVPIALAVVSSITFKVGDRVTKLAEQAYSQPADVAYTKTGMIFGAKVFERLRTAQISDPRFDQNLRSFVKGCIYYDLLEGHYTAGELARQNDLWTYVTVTRGTNPGRSLEYVNTSGSSDIISCTTAAQRLNSEWNATLSSSISLFQKRLRPELPESQLQSAFLQEMGALHPMMVGASRDATNTFQQVLMINAVRRGVPGFSAEAGNDAMGVFSETQAELHTRNQQRLMGGVAEKAVPLLKILTELLILGIFPVIFPAMLLPGMTMRIMQGYFGGFLYLQLWGPMYVILHTIMMWKSAVDTAAATYIPGATAGLKLANLEAVSGLNAEIASLAGYLSLSIPVLASTIAFAGAAAVGKGGESFMASFRGGAEAAAGTATTGNVSIGNTAYANHSFSNLSGMRQSTSAELDFGRSAYVDSGLNRIETNADGTVSVSKAAQSQMAVNMRHSEGISAAAVQAASERRQESVDLRHSLSEGKSRMQSESTEFVQQWMSGTSSTWTQGRDNRETWGAMEQMMDSQAQTLQRSFNISEQQAKTITAHAALEAYGQGGLSSGALKAAGIDLGAGVKGSTGVNGSRSGTSAEVDALNAAKSSMSNHSFSDRFDQSTANYASEAFAKTQSASQSEALKRSDTFTSTRSITDTMDRSEGLARSYEERADLTRSQGASAEINYANAFEGYAMNQLVGRRDAYGAEIDADRARGILAGHSMADMNLVHEVTGSFHRDMATRIDTPELIERNQNVGQNAVAASPGPVRVLQDGSGASLREGLGRGSEGRPGGDFQMDRSPETNTGGGTNIGTASPVRQSQRASSDNGPGLRSMEIQPPTPAAPGPGWAGGSNLQPGFSSPVRDSIREDTTAVSEALAARRTPDFEKGGGRALGEVISDIDPRGRATSTVMGAVFDPGGAHPQGHQVSQSAGGRLGRRFAR